MLETLVVDGVEFKVDPETLFWGTGDPAQLEALHGRVRESLRLEVRDLRFSTQVLLLYLNPVDACNARCPYCYLPGRVKGRGRRMSYEEMGAVAGSMADHFRSAGVKGSIVFHGSEPMLNKEAIFRVIEDHRDRLHFGIQTNGTLLAEGDAEFIRARGVSIGISLDSPVEETNDRLRGKGHYAKVVGALEWLRGYRGLSVVTTVTSHNVGHLTEMVKFLSERGVGLCLMNPVRGTQKEALPFRPDPLRLASEFIGAVEEAIRRTKEGRRIVIGDFANILLGVIAPSARVMMCDVSPCGAGRRFFSVTADGTAYPCGEFIGMDEFAGGNILTDSVQSIIGSEGFARVRGRTVEGIPECGSCVFRNMCGAPCPAEIYATNGTLLVKSYYSEFYKRAIEHAFRVIHRGDVEHVVRRAALREIYNLGAPGPAGEA